MTVEEFIDPLRQERLARGIFQSTLAAQIGVAQPTFSGWETHSKTPADSLMRSWAASLDVVVPEGVSGRRPAACGTLAGFHRHDRDRTPVCQSCREVYRGYRRDRRNSGRSAS